MAISEGDFITFGRSISASLAAIADALVEIRHAVRRIEASVGGDMARSLDEVLEQVRQTRGVINSMKTYIDGLKQQVADALANASPPVSEEDKAKIDAIFDEAHAAADEGTAAIAANPAPNDPPVQP